MEQRRTRRQVMLPAIAAAFMAGCSAPLPKWAPPPPSPPQPAAPLAPSAAPPLPLALPRPSPAPPATKPVPISTATTPLAYRKDAAAHVYGRHSERIMKGKMPSMLYAVAVLEVDVGPRGEMLATNWRRAPTHAPEVMQEIERMVRDAAPFPAPARLGKVTYTDVWLWDSSGKFQLDTLTEGQD